MRKDRVLANRGKLTIPAVAFVINLRIHAAILQIHGPWKSWETRFELLDVQSFLTTRVVEPVSPEWRPATPLQNPKLLLRGRIAASLTRMHAERP